MLCRQCHWPNLCQRNAQASRLLFDKGTGSRRADLVHLKVHHLAVFHGNVFGILAADLKDRIRIRI